MLQIRSLRHQETQMNTIGKCYTAAQHLLREDELYHSVCSFIRLLFLLSNSGKGQHFHSNKIKWDYDVWFYNWLGG